MTSASDSENIEEIKIDVIKMWNTIESFKKINEELSIKVQDLEKSNEELSIKVQNLEKSNQSQATVKFQSQATVKFLNTSEQFTVESPTVRDKHKQPKSEDFINTRLEGNLSQPSRNKRHQLLEEEKEESYGDHKPLEESETEKKREWLQLSRVRSTSVIWQGGISQTSGGEIVNTNNLFMLATSLAYQSAKNPTLKKRLMTWMMLLPLLFLTFTQVFILYNLTSASEYQTCTKHTDCRAGTFCDGFTDYWRQPRCESCFSLPYEGYSCDLDADLKDYFEVSWFDSHKTSNVFIESDDISHIFSSEEDAMYCVVEHYCKETTPIKLSDTCSLFLPLMEKADFSGYSILFVMTIISAAYFYEDMKEAEIEHAVLDFIVSSEPADSLSYALVIIRIMNRARRFFLPFLTAMGGASIILTDDLSSKNITLNILALVFIIEADNLIGNLVISKNQQEISDTLVEIAKYKNVRFNPSEIKRDALIVVVLMFVLILKIDVLMRQFSCSITRTLSILFMYISTHVFVIYKFLGNLIFSQKPKKVARAVQALLWMWIGIYVIGLMSAISYYAMTPMAFDEIPPVPMSAAIISSLCFVFRPQQVLEDSYNPSWKNTFVNIAMAIAWLLVQGWAQSVSLAQAGL